MARILLVEDDEALAYAASKSLALAGHDVTVARDTMLALGEIDGEIPHDLFLVDIGMPRGKPHGLAFARMAQARHPGTPVIFLTGSTPEQLLDAGPLPGKAFQKPIDFTILAAEIDTLLRA